MEELPLLLDEVSQLTSLLSLITDRPPALNDGKGSDTTHAAVECGLQDVSGSDFESDLTDPDAATILLKRSALDRLAEILARYKTDKKHPDAKKNRDAKHVTAVVMVECSERGSVRILCAKNEGLDDIDVRFLRKLRGLLESAGVRAHGRDELIEQVFNITFNHQESRIAHYSSILRNAFTKASKAAKTPPSNRLTTEALHSYQQTCSYKMRPWKDNRGLSYEFFSDKMTVETASNVAEDCLSDQGDQEVLENTSREVQELMSELTPKAGFSSRLKTLLVNVYDIVRHPRHRPVFKTSLRQALHSNGKLFRTAWKALLFLTRVFYGAKTLVDVATETPNFRSIEFVSLPAEAFRSQTTSQPTRSPLQVAESMGLEPSSPGWRALLESENKSREFMKLQTSKRSVHAEIQLICALDGRSQESSTEVVLPYIGCSKKCCFFCESFRLAHGSFNARGTHETIFPKWTLPTSIITSQGDPRLWARALVSFSKCLKDLLRTVFAIPYPLPSRDAIQQSSAALSTAISTHLERAAYTVRPLTATKLILPFGMCATEGQVQITPFAGEPGLAALMAPGQPEDDKELPIEEAEFYKINHDRGALSLENIAEMPPEQDFRRTICRRCCHPAKFRCSLCWTWYCSKTCQVRNWRQHVFTCRARNRPNQLDFLRLNVREAHRKLLSRDDDMTERALRDFFADIDSCRTFGFNSCFDGHEAERLICLYYNVIRGCRSPMTLLQGLLDTGALGNFLEYHCSLGQLKNPQSTCSCEPWFLDVRSSDLFPIPSASDQPYRWSHAIKTALASLSGIHDKRALTRSEAEVLKLFIRIQPTLGQLPDIKTSTWINFGFCYCTTHSQRQELANVYRCLAKSDATFNDIVLAYDDSAIDELMVAHGIDISALRRQGIAFTKPPASEYPVFRLMVGVDHALSGQHCNCFIVKNDWSCHIYYESHFDIEVDVGYGFHLSTPWERWQLLNFYRSLFRHPEFDFRAMAAAKNKKERGSLERYIDTLVPDMRKKLYANDRLGNHLLFPNLDGRIEVKYEAAGEPHAHISCDCSIHDVGSAAGGLHSCVCQWSYTHSS
ncbi:hypothetical protein GGR56DRAFT_643744 [Xylariaceae sp. FL0804]|nr:hypothetical protein GGR56DRAFT_643744 [Xylariaceae sp. FL0804]